MAPKRCCCGVTSCIIFEDNFNRANASSLGLNWLDAGSGWSIDTNQAVGTGVAILDIPHPTPSGSMTVSFLTVDEEIGDIYRVLLNVLDDQNYHVATFTKTDAAEGTIAIGKVVGGSYTLITSLPIVGMTGTTRRFGASISSLEFCASITNSVFSMVYSASTPSLITDGIYSGMDGVRADSAITIDDFIFAHHSETILFCSVCVCSCGGYAIPPVLTATLTGAGRMSGLSCSFALNWNRVLGNWEGTATCCGQPFDIKLFCPVSNDIMDYRAVIIGCVDSDVSGTVGVDGYVSAGVRTTKEGTCNPIYLLFGTYVVSGTDFACACGPAFTPGTFILEITI